MVCLVSMNIPINEQREEGFLFPLFVNVYNVNNVSSK